MSEIFKKQYSLLNVFLVLTKMDIFNKIEILNGLLSGVILPPDYQRYAQRKRWSYGSGTLTEKGKVELYCLNKLYMCIVLSIFNEQPFPDIYKTYVPLGIALTDIDLILEGLYQKDYLAVNNGYITGISEKGKLYKAEVISQSILLLEETRKH